MEKFGVQVDEHTQGDEKRAGKGPSCPRCGERLRQDTNVPTCPTCGTEPFEKKPEAGK